MTTVSLYRGDDALYAVVMAEPIQDCDIVYTGQARSIVDVFTLLRELVNRHFIDVAAPVTHLVLWRKHAAPDFMLDALLAPLWQDLRQLAITVTGVAWQRVEIAPTVPWRELCDKITWPATTLPLCYGYRKAVAAAVLARSN